MARDVIEEVGQRAAFGTDAVQGGQPRRVVEEIGAGNDEAGDAEDPAAADRTAGAGGAAGRPPLERPGQRHRRHPAQERQPERAAGDAAGCGEAGGEHGDRARQTVRVAEEGEGQSRSHESGEQAGDRRRAQRRRLGLGVELGFFEREPAALDGDQDRSEEPEVGGGRGDRDAEADLDQVRRRRGEQRDRQRLVRRPRTDRARWWRAAPRGRGTRPRRRAHRSARRGKRARAGPAARARRRR